MVVRPYRFGGGVYLLDLYPDALFAYSVRLLSSTYLGPLMEASRQSDGVTAEVYSDANFEVSLDSSVIITSGSSGASILGELVAAPGYSDPDGLGAGDSAMVVAWKDQSGGAVDMTQDISAPPFLVDSGTLQTRGAKPTIDMRTGQGLIADDLPPYVPNCSGVHVFSDVLRAQYAFRGPNQPRIFRYENLRYNNGSGNQGGSYNAITDTSRVLNFLFWGTSANSSMRVNGNQDILNSTFADSTADQAKLGQEANVGNLQKVQELVYWGRSLVADAENIEANVNGYFGVY